MASGEQRIIRVVAIGTFLMLALVSCGSSKPQNGSSVSSTAPSGSDGSSTSAGGSTTSGAGSTTSGGGPKAGGSVVLGIEQWPECLNPVTCGAPSSVWWSVLEHVLPMAMVPDTHGNYVASPVLVEAPSVANGDISTDPFKISYKINPKASWADGSPITSKDFDFTWRAIMNTKGAYSTSGYDQISAIDTSAAKTAVVSFSKPYVAWQELFGGTQWGLLEMAAFPDLATNPKPDVSALMKDKIPFSGGPWTLQSWSKEQAVLVRNPTYYGKVPLLDKMTMVPFDNTNTEIQALLSGQVDAIQPQVGNASVIDQIGKRNGIKVVSRSGLLFEALWLNLASPPLDDPKVREALMYAIDRQSLVDAVVKINNPDAKVVNCGLVAFPGVGPWCDTAQSFSGFTYDPKKSVELLKAAGYDCSGATTGPCTKAGKSLVLPFATTAEDTRRTTGQQLLKDKLKGTGFDFQIDNKPAGVLFTDVVPTGNFTVTEYARGSYDPSVTGYLGCEGIPTKDNGFKGGNWNHWCNQQATDLMHQSDQALDPAKRAELMAKIYELEAKDFVSLPLYVLPEVGAFRSDRLGGPVGDYLGNLLSQFYNANEWYLNG